MKSLSLTGKLLAGAIMVCAMHVQAQEDPAADGWVGSIGAGLVTTSGNNETESGNAHFDVSRIIGDWTHSLNSTALYTADANRTTAEKYFLSLQTDWALSERSYLFGFVSYDDDRFSSFDYQATAALGYGRHLIVKDNMNLKVEFGPGYRLSKPFVFLTDAAGANVIDPITERPIKLGTRDENEVVARFAENFDWQFSNNAKLIQELNVEAGSDNTVSRFLVAVETNVIGSIALRVSYAIKNNTDVSPGTDKTDTETGISIAYSF